MGPNDDLATCYLNAGCEGCHPRALGPCEEEEYPAPEVVAPARLGDLSAENLSDQLYTGAAGKVGITSSQRT